MLDRSNEIIKKLNRLVNDRSLNPQARKHISDAIRHIRDLHDGVARIRELHMKLAKKSHNNRSHSLEETA